MKRDVKKPAAIFLDWDGTLVDSFAFLLAAHNHVRGEIGLDPFTSDMFKEYFGQPREILYKNLYGARREDAKKFFEKFVREHHLKFLEPLPSAGELVRVIHDLGITSGVVSNKKGDFIRAEIGSFGWTPMFASIVGAGEAERDKPAPDPLILAVVLARVDAEPADIWYVGDSETDAQCAAAAGSPFVLIDHESGGEGWAAKYKPFLTFSGCGEFSEFLRSSLKI